MILNTQNLANTSASKVNVFSIKNDWRKRYIQVANLSTFNAALPAIKQIKITEQEITGILRNKQKTLKKWKPKNVKQNITVFNKELKTSLFQFFPKDGVMVIPYEIVFYNTKNKVEEQISQKYPQFMSYDLQLDPSSFKEYFKMKEETLSLLDDSDYDDVLYSFYSDNIFGTKKFTSYIWYDIRALNVKKMETGPVIILEGYIYFWGDLFLETYLKDSLIEYKKYLFTREFTLKPNKMIPMFLRYKSGNIFYDWTCWRIKNYFKEGSNVIDDMFRSHLGLKDWRGISIDVRFENLKDFCITFNGIYRKDAIPNEMIFNDITRNKTLRHF